MTDPGSGADSEEDDAQPLSRVRARFRVRTFKGRTPLARRMPPAFLQVAIPVLYVYDEGTLPEVPPGFDMGLLPVISRALKEHANTSKVTVITGAPTAA